MEQQGWTIDELIGQGELLFSEGRLEEAEEYFLGLLPQYPSESIIKNNLGTIKFSQGDIITAKEYFLSALASDTGNHDALSNLKELYRQYGSWEEYPQSLIKAKTPAAFINKDRMFGPSLSIVVSLERKT